MIIGTLVIGEINYESTVYPLLRRLRNVELPGFVRLFFEEMGDDTGTLLLNVLDYMEESEKEELILWLLNRYQTQLRDVLSGVLATHQLGSTVRVGSVWAEKITGESGFALKVSELDIDYDTLLRSELVSGYLEQFADKKAEHMPGLFKGAAKLALKAGTLLPQEELEKRLIHTLEKTAMQKKAVGKLTEALNAQGLYLKIKAIRAEQISANHRTAGIPGSEGPMPEKIERSIVHAAAAYFRSSL